VAGAGFARIFAGGAGGAADGVWGPDRIPGGEEGSGARAGFLSVLGGGADAFA
jgi:hypothetical protein